MQMKKRMLSWLLTLAMVFSLVPGAAVMAANTPTAEDFELGGQKVVSTESGGLTMTASFGAGTQGENGVYHVKSDASELALKMSFNYTGDYEKGMDGLALRIKPDAKLAEALTLTGRDKPEMANFDLVTGSTTSSIDMICNQLSVPQNNTLNLYLTKSLADGEYSAEVELYDCGDWGKAFNHMSMTAKLYVGDINHTGTTPGPDQPDEPDTVSLKLTEAIGCSAKLMVSATETGVYEELTTDTVTKGTWAKLTNVTADIGYDADDLTVKVNGAAVEADKPFQVNADTTVSVELAKITYRVVAEPAVYENGTVTFKVNGQPGTTAQSGDRVEIIAEPAEGYRAIGTLVVNDGAVTVANNAFIMPAENAIVKGIEFVEASTVNTYDITLQTPVNGTANLNGVTSAEAGATVTVFVKPDADYTVASVVFTPEGGVNGTAALAGSADANGMIPYTFTMPAAKVNVVVTFRPEAVDPQPGYFKAVGSVVIHDVLNGNSVDGDKAAVNMTGVEVKLTDGNTNTSVVKLNADGTFETGELVTGNNYTIQATLALDKAPVREGWAFPATASAYIQSMKAAVDTSKAVTDDIRLTLILFYDADVNNDGKVERVYAGPDGIFGTTDDVYGIKPATANDQSGNVVAGSAVEKVRIPQSDSNGTEVWVHVAAETAAVTSGNVTVEYSIGDAGSPKAYYDWTVDGKAVKVYVNDDLIAGAGSAGDNGQDYYKSSELYPEQGGIKVQHAGPDGKWDGTYEVRDLDIFVGADNTPGTRDDYYLHDVNVLGDNVAEHVEAGEDGVIGTCDDEYVFNNKTVYAGEDLVAGSNDDWYAGDTNGDGAVDPDKYDHSDTHDKIFIGLDRTPGTADDSYMKDIDGDGIEERVFVGEDGAVGGDDDNYFAHIPSAKDPAGKAEEHETANGIEYDDADIPEDFVKVTVDPNGEDHYQWNVKDSDAPGGEIEVTVKVGEDGEAGTADDHYAMNADDDADLEDVFVGGDGKPGTKDDYYDEDVNGNEDEERVYAGEDEEFGTCDDYYNAIVNTPDGDTAKVPVYAGEDEKFSDPGSDPASDDWYPWDTNKDGKTDPDVYNGSDDHDKVFLDGDSLAGTDDDYYFEDVNGDGEDEKVFVGEDGIPGTDDDYYEKDIDGDGEDEKMFPGDNGEFEDGEPDNDDYYEKDIGEDGESEVIKVYPGEDDKLGTPDDEYYKDIDEDEKTETIYVGDDKTAGTDDDWFFIDLTFNANGGTVTVDGQTAGSVTMKGNKVFTNGTLKEAVALTALPTASRSGYSFTGWGKTLEAVKALTSDTVLTASWQSNYRPPVGGGGGGGGYGPTYYTVTFVVDGKTVKTVSVRSGHTISAISIPDKDGMTALGWFTDKNGKTEFDFDTKITRSITLYASYKEGGSHVNTDIVPGIGDVLQTYPHVAYIFGYGDNTVRPNAPMTRAEAASVFYRLLNAKTRAAYETTAHTFTDVPAGAWYEKAVATLANLGIVSGYGDHKFGPNDTMTRAQFATICARIGKLNASGATKFTDVPETHWAAGYIKAAADNGWISGYGDGTFGPDNSITRAQVVTILNRVLGRTPKSIANMSGLKYRTWSDNNPDAWYFLEVVEAGTSHDCEFDADNVETWTAILKED